MKKGGQNSRECEHKKRTQKSWLERSGEREVASELGGEGGAEGLSEGFVGLCGLEPGKKAIEIGSQGLLMAFQSTVSVQQ